MKTFFSIKEFSQKDRPALSRLLKEGFETSDFFSDFPVWDPVFQPSRRILRLGHQQQETGEWVSCVHLRFLVWKGAWIALLGGVTTALAFRHQGLARELVDYGLRQLFQINPSLGGVFTWGAGADFYAQWGFQPWGRQWRGLIRSQRRGGIREQSCSPLIHKGWTPLLFELFQKDRAEGTGFPLEKEDEAWFAAHRHVQWRWMGSMEAPRAVVGVGRGIDLTHWVHEYAGPRSDLLYLFSQVALEDPLAEWVGSPFRGATFWPVFQGVEEPSCLAFIPSTPMAQQWAQARLEEGAWIRGLDSA